MEINKISSSTQTAASSCPTRDARLSPAQGQPVPKQRVCVYFSHSNDCDE